LIGEFKVCKHIGHRHSIFCILPPYVLRSIARNGSREQAEAALNTIAADNTFRAMRAAQPQAADPRVAAFSVPVREKHRTIFDTHHTQNLPGKAVRSEGDAPTGDKAVDEAYDGLGDTYDFYLNIYDRNSIDDEGLPLDATVHFGRKYNNAFWDGQRMVFGDGDGVLFNRFTVAVDVIGHELTHGVTQDEAQLAYFNQSGALNESMSDVMGVLIKQYALKQTVDQADWLIGAGLLGKNIHGVALRSMKAPGTAFDDPILGKDPQPGLMKDYVNTFDDNGGVHTNSGIPNHAFYLVAAALGGYAWEHAGRIWYETLRDSHLRPNTGFRRFARLTLNNAAHLYGANSNEKKAVQDAWKQVGISLA
jgi:Zn-dependent metalloprotease